MLINPDKATCYKCKRVIDCNLYKFSVYKITAELPENEYVKDYNLNLCDGCFSIIMYNLTDLLRV